jgi:PAS domain-containing protein
MSYWFGPGADWFASLPMSLTIGGEGPSGNIGFLVAACGLALAFCVWSLGERERRDALRRLAAAQARARAETLFRDGLIGQVREAIVAWDIDSLQHLSFGGGAQLLDACLAGPDRVALSLALDNLRHTGTAFELTARHDTNVVVLRGCPIGRHAAVFIHQDRRRAQATADYRAVLEALPIPVWLRDKDLRLIWANSAFVETTGAASLDRAIAAGGALERSERDLAFVARDATKAVTAKRYAVVQGVRHAYSLWSHPLRDGTVAGAACDLTGVSDAGNRSRLDAEGHAHALNHLSLAVAIFGPDRKLEFCNRSYSRLWGLEKIWLDSRPTAGEILDRLRELRRLPEQSDFAAWKRDRLKLFEDGGRASEELWHLPNGTTLRVASWPRPSGGLLYMVEDVSDRLHQESAYNALIKVQQATLDMLQEGVAVFGTDGRLRLHNTAFAELWQLRDDELLGAPHLNAIAESCTARFGRQPTWEIISSSVTSASPKDVDGSIVVERSDGRIVSLSLARLPDGAVLVTFTDVTDQVRLESALREAPPITYWHDSDTSRSG